MQYLIVYFAYKFEQTVIKGISLFSDIKKLNKMSLSWALLIAKSLPWSLKLLKVLTKVLKIHCVLNFTRTWGFEVIKYFHTHTPAEYKTANFRESYSKS